MASKEKKDGLFEGIKRKRMCDSERDVKERERTKRISLSVQFVPFPFSK